MVVKRYIINKRGKVQPVYVKHLKKFNAKYGTNHKKRKVVAKRRALVFSIKSEPVEVLEEILSGRDIQADMLNRLRIWAGSNPKIQRTLIESLEDARINDEGDGVWQLNSVETPKGSLEEGVVKLRYDTKQKNMIFYIRGYSYGI